MGHNKFIQVEAASRLDLIQALAPMPDKSSKHVRAAIRVEGGRDNVVSNNISVGSPVLHASDTERLTATGNISVESGYLSPKKSWYERPVGIVVLMVIGGLIVGAVLFALRWN